MILLNFAHPITPDRLQQIGALAGQPVERVIEVHSQIDPQQLLVPQLMAMADAVGLSSEEWQTLPMLVNSLSLNFVTVTLLAELHARCGYFPAHLRMRPQSGVIPPQYEVAEILDLQAVRNAARQRR